VICPSLLPETCEILCRESKAEGSHAKWHTCEGWLLRTGVPAPLKICEHTRKEKMQLWVFCPLYCCKLMSLAGGRWGYGPGNLFWEATPLQAEWSCTDRFEPVNTSRPNPLCGVEVWTMWNFKQHRLLEFGTPWWSEWRVMTMEAKGRLFHLHYWVPSIFSDRFRELGREWTSKHQCTMQDGWEMDTKHFLVVFVSHR
jgi:hypothetical protein